MNPPESQPEPISPLSNETAGRLRRRTPPPLMTVAIIAANLLMAFTQWAAAGYPVRGDTLSNDYAEWVLGAKVPSLIAHGEYWRLVTANFLHASLTHLLVNMVGIALLGQLVEILYGRRRLFVIYTLSSIAGATTSYMLTAQTSLGASTGALGLVGAVLLHNLRYRRYLPPRVNATYPLLWIVVAAEFVWDTFGGNIDVWGHAGGLVGGIVVAALLESRLAGAAQDHRDWLPLPTAVATAGLFLAYGAYGILASLPAETQLLRAGRSQNPQARIASLQRELAARPYFFEARVSLIGELIRSGELDAARDAYRESLRQEARDLVNRQELAEAVARAYYQRSSVLYSRNQWEGALSASDEVLALAPKGVAPFPATPISMVAAAANTSAWILVDKLERDLPRAEQLAKQAVAGSPKEAAPIDTLAWVYYKQKRYTEALTEQLKALDLLRDQPIDGNNADYYYHLGAIWEKLDRPREAIANYTLATQGGSQPAGDALRRLSSPSTIPPSPVTPDPPKRDPVAERGLI